jgi:hypothetical protein
MDYQDQLVIGNAFNQAIQSVLSDYGNSYLDQHLDHQPALVSAIAQAILIQLDQSGYQIVRK